MSFFFSASSAPPRETRAHAKVSLTTFEAPAGVSALRRSLSRAQTHPCVILSGGWWEGGSEGSSEAQRAMASSAKARHYVLPSDSAQPNRGAGSGCPKQLLYAPGLILRFTPSHPTSLRMTLNLQYFFSQVQRSRCEFASKKCQCLCGFFGRCAGHSREHKPTRVSS